MSARDLPQTPIERAQQALKDWERSSFCNWDSRAYIDLIRDLLAELERLKNARASRELAELAGSPPYRW